MSVVGGVVDSAIAIVLAIVMSGLGAMMPDTSSATADGCGDLLAYRNDVYGTFDGYPVFTDWWANSESPAIDAMRPALAGEVVSEGRAFVADLAAIEVPGVYTEGHAGWVGLYDFFNDLIAWVVLDEGDEPDSDDLQTAIDNIAIGEEVAAAVCAADIADLDGFVLIDPDGIDDVDIPADPLDIDKDFL